MLPIIHQRTQVDHGSNDYPAVLVLFVSVPINSDSHTISWKKIICHDLQPKSSTAAAVYTSKYLSQVRYQPASCTTLPYMLCLSITHRVLVPRLHASSTSTKLALLLVYLYPLIKHAFQIFRFNPARRTPDLLLIRSILHKLVVYAQNVW